MAIKTVGIIGCGLMGGGIAQVVAQAGLNTYSVEATKGLLDRGLGGLRRSLEGLVGKGKLDAKEKDSILGRITGTTRLEDLKACDLVIEAITENIVIKKETFAKLDEICPPHAILASNTSSCMITEMAAATKRPEKVLGLHFFNPAPVMRLCEVVRTLLTSDAAVKSAWEFVLAVG